MLRDIRTRIVHADDASDPSFGPFPAVKPDPASPVMARWVRANPAMRDCVDCATPFYSRSAGNVVCPICREASTATFEGAVS